MSVYDRLVLVLLGIALAWLWVAFLIGAVVSVLDARAARRVSADAVRRGSSSQVRG